MLHTACLPFLRTPTRLSPWWRHSLAKNRCLEVRRETHSLVLISSDLWISWFGFFVLGCIEIRIGIKPIKILLVLSEYFIGDFWGPMALARDGIGFKLLTLDPTLPRGHWPVTWHYPEVFELVTRSGWFDSSIMCLLEVPNYVPNLQQHRFQTTKNNKLTHNLTWP